MTTKLGARPRRLLIMMMDVVMILLSIPICLLLSQSNLSFDPFSPRALLMWAAVLLYSHFLFRACGLYSMVWRFASTPDFFNILKSCAGLVLALYSASIAARWIAPFTGFNERQFIVLFFVTFALISAPRVFYRYLREGLFWTKVGSPWLDARKALFVGRLDEADVIIRYTRANSGQPVRIIGIITSDQGAAVGTSIHGVPIVADNVHALEAIEEYIRATDKLDMVIIGQAADKEVPGFLDIVRVARNAGVAVDQFSGMFQLRRSNKLVLEKVEMETILRRETVASDQERLANFLSGKKVMVTGGAGSIGRKLVLRALELGAESVLIADISEFNIFQIQSQVDRADDVERLNCRIVDITDKDQVRLVVDQFKPDVIYHAAALKHVPLLETNWTSAIRTNVFGTLNCVEAAAEAGVAQFVLVSSDKAADPSSVLGLTKRAAEQIINAKHSAAIRRPAAKRTNFLAVRFGNVFGSDGSVATIFERQIAMGGPVTLTDPKMTRYFMTIGEAVDLVIMSSLVSASRPFEDSHGIYMLDMGQPVSIMTVAETMIRLAGLRPHQDIPIIVTGSRPGDKLHESIIGQSERQIGIGETKVFGLETGVYNWGDVESILAALRKAYANYDKAAAISLMKGFYKPAGGTASAGKQNAAQSGMQLSRPSEGKTAQIVRLYAGDESGKTG